MSINQSETQQLRAKSQTLESNPNLSFSIEKEITKRFVSRLQYMVLYNPIDIEKLEYENNVDNFQYHYMKYLCRKEESLEHVLDAISKLSKNYYFSEFMFAYFMGQITAFLEKDGLNEEADLHQDSMLLLWQKLSLLEDDSNYKQEPPLDLFE